MPLTLIPKDVKFLDLFAAAGANLAEAAAGLRDLVENFDRLDQRIAGIQRLEKRGDQIDRDINQRLEDSFVAPFDREDIHELTVRLDDVVDYVQAVGESLSIYDVKKPTDDCVRLAQILAEQGIELAAALAKLEQMKDLTIHLEKIHELEHEADGVSRAAIGRLFRESHDPLEVIKWRELYLQLENAIDAAEDAAEAIERMIHKRV
jgi:predicted phosphate transport protein (TIGR00153 family)